MDKDLEYSLALAKGARLNGSVLKYWVTDISIKDGRVTAVQTPEGQIKAEYVVNCAGMWGREVWQMAGVDIPLHANEHFYAVTEPIEGLQP